MKRLLITALSAALFAAPALGDEAPKLKETVAWFNGLPKLGGGVNKGLDPDRFKKLTEDGAKALKELTLGGHAYQPDGKLGGHLELKDADYRYLRGLPALETLKFPENNLGDEALAQIGQIKTLKSLMLMENKITNGGLKHLSGLPALTQLDLRWNKQLDDTCLPHLVKLTGLKELNVFQTQISAEGVKKLEKALPNCKVINTKPQ
jgi:Leucine Rich Repeat (LRR) protein